MTSTKLRLPIVVERAVAETKALQTQIGSEFERRLRHGGIATTCIKGCSHCCRHPFLITILEGLLLVRHLRESGQWTSALRKRLEDHRDRTLNLAHDVWLLSNTPCPLLEGGLCTAYKVRPLHCRVTFSVGDPAKCHPHELGSETRLIPSTDIIIDYNYLLLDRLKKIEVSSLLFPVSEAVLLAREIEVGNITLEDVVSRYTEDVLRG